MLIIQAFSKIVIIKSRLGHFDFKLSLKST